jgi:glycyl-tRNA synthetase
MASSSSSSTIPKKTLQSVMRSRFFVRPAFEIYGGKAGLYDLGPPLATLEQNVFYEWRKHFIEYEKMLELNCTNIVPYIVLKNSGHVDKFSDVAVKDSETNEMLRADKWIEKWVDSEVEKEEVKGLFNVFFFFYYF